MRQDEESRIQLKALTFAHRWSGPPIELDPKEQDDALKRAYNEFVAFCEYTISRPFNNDGDGDDEPKS